MAQRRFLALTACLAGSLALVGCCNTSSRCCPGDTHARTSSVSGVQFASDSPGQAKSEPTAFASGGRDEPSAPLFSLNKIQRTSVELVSLPDTLSKILPAKVEPPPAPAEPEQAEKSRAKSESIVSAFTRQLGYTAKPTGPVQPPPPPPESKEARENPKKFFKRGPGIARRQINRMIETFSSDGKQYTAQAAKPAAAPAVAQAPASPENFKEIEMPVSNPPLVSNPLMEQIHRDATALPELPPPLPSPAPPVAAQPKQNVSSPAQKQAPTHLPAVAMVQEPAPPAPAKPAPVVPAVAPPAPQPPSGIVQISARFSHSADYTSLSGEVQQFRRGWRLRYAGVDEVDEHGGSVMLVGDGKLDGLRDGQYVRVQGQIVDGDARTGRVFQVRTLEITDR